MLPVTWGSKQLISTVSLVSSITYNWLVTISLHMSEKMTIIKIPKSNLLQNIGPNIVFYLFIGLYLKNLLMLK